MGHLVAPRAEGSTEPDSHKDDVHQYFALPFLRGLFADSVLEPIRMHVDAKRYLCATRDGYYEALSEDSKRSLALQGGIYDAAQAQTFLAQPGAADGVDLRIWDDLAKVPGLPTPPLAHYLERARRCTLAAA